MSFETPKRGADENLRSLERAWKESGSDKEKARFLQAKLRSGELTSKELELAARLGDKASLFITGIESPDEQSIEGLIQLIDQSNRKDLQTRSIIAIGRAVLEKEYQHGDLDVSEVIKKKELSALIDQTVLDPDKYKSDLINEVMYGDVPMGSTLTIMADQAIGQDLSGSPELHPFDLAMKYLIDSFELGEEETNERLNVIIKDSLIPWLLKLDDDIADRVANGL